MITESPSSWRKTKLEVFRIAWRESILSYRKALKTARSDYFSSLLEENKHNLRYLFNTVAKLTKNKASTVVEISQQHNSNDLMNYFFSKIDTIRDQIITMQPSATVSHRIVHSRSPEEQFHSISTIGEEELYKLVKSAKPTTYTVSHRSVYFPYILAKHFFLSFHATTLKK